MAQCKCYLKTGKQCRYNAKLNSKYCGIHKNCRRKSGASPPRKSSIPHRKSPIPQIPLLSQSLKSYIVKDYKTGEIKKWSGDWNDDIIIEIIKELRVDNNPVSRYQIVKILGIKYFVTSDATIRNHVNGAIKRLISSKKIKQIGQSFIVY